MNPDEILKELKELKEGLKALAETEEEHTRALKELYEKNVELGKRLKERE